jgi:hypothetical protein
VECAAQPRVGLRFRGMPEKPAQNLSDGAVPSLPDGTTPKPREPSRLSTGEKKAMELGAQAEHTHGKEREKLQEAAEKAAEDGTR